VLGVKRLENVQVGQLRSFYSCTIPNYSERLIMLDIIVGKGTTDRRYIEHSSQLSL
jgi:hypothetical protein